MKQNMMEWRWIACGVSRRKGKKHTGFCLENLREGDHLEDLGVAGRMMFRWELVNRFYLA
jgi:hypothetical protein